MPRRCSSARVAWIVVGPTALSARPASAIVPAVQPERGGDGDDRPVAGAALDLLVGAAGSGADRDPISIRSSASWIAVVYGPTWKSSIETTRSPLEPAITDLALSAEHTAERSSAASACASEPPIVPRFRTTGSAITRSASAKTGKWRARLRLEQLVMARQGSDPDLPSCSRM